MRAVKFGGSSVADAERLRGAGAILAAWRAAGSVTAVVSAMAGVTDGLLRVADDAMRGGVTWPDGLRALHDRHLTAYQDLTGAAPDLFRRHWTEIEHDAATLARTGSTLSQPVQALTAARFSGWGERLAVGLLAAATEAEGANVFPVDDAPVLLRGRERAGATPEPSPLATRAWLLPRLAMPVMRGAIPILPGYIARDAEGRLTTLGRNGSDHSAAIIAAALGATRLNIYSDVAGVYTADPRVVPDARLLRALTYDEAARIATLGAKALHPRAVEPLAARSIPLEMRATASPAAPGSDIGSEERMSLQHARDVEWVVASRPAAPPGQTEVTALRLPAWPWREDTEADRQDADALATIFGRLVGATPVIGREEASVIVATERAAAVVREAHAFLAGRAADRRAPASGERIAAGA